MSIVILTHDTNIVTRPHSQLKVGNTNVYCTANKNTIVECAAMMKPSRFLKVNQRVFYTSKYKQYSQRRFTRVQDCKFDSKNKITSFLRIFGLHGLVTLTAPLALLGLLSVSHVYMGIRISIPALLMEELNIFRLKLK